MAEQYRKILLVATNWIGDAVMNLPFVDALHERYPVAEIHVLCRPWVSDVFLNHPAVTSRINVPGKDVRELHKVARSIRQMGFDCAFILPNSFRSSLVPWLARIPSRIGYRGDWRRLLLTLPISRSPRIERRHQVYYYLYLLGISPDDNCDRTPRIFVSSEEAQWADEYLKRHVPDGKEVYGLNPGATFGTAKRWGEEPYAEVGRWLVEMRNSVVLVFGSPAEKELAETVAGKIGQGAVVTAGETTLRQAAALMARCRRFITNDTGTMHVAAAVGTPVIAVFGSTDPSTTYPYGQGHIIVREPVACSPCLLRDCPIDHRCMTRIPSTRVIEQLTE